MISGRPTALAWPNTQQFSAQFSVLPRANRTSNDVPEFKGLAKEPTIDDPFSTTTSTNYAYTTKALQLCCHDTTS